MPDTVNATRFGSLRRDFRPTNRNGGLFVTCPAEVAASVGRECPLGTGC